ncbi:Phage terminase, small subunit [Paenibacillus sp. UNCCL117]|uniref:P27 family phage terminase small subunit n=1 Tax=unclassified Paenibacillus TaxID=185978 RepID=UPI0008896582|nr:MULTISPECIES: P27 family phage terminase small subunit [unclassified Paenibacillus]SDD27360.1 Phage terminase, small subunit [Paenibacillus sp. cl123]SFW40553.1 Phage terminase, small subunit [Paenibacillus sp. UNCCL117]
MGHKPKKEIKHRAAKQLFEIIIRELEIDENLSDRTIMITDNMALLEQLKQQHIEDIKNRGVVELFVNGAQQMYRQNKSVDAVIKIIEHQRKLQAELKLTPASDRKVSGVVNPEGGDQGDDFTAF